MKQHTGLARCRVSSSCNAFLIATFSLVSFLLNAAAGDLTYGSVDRSALKNMLGLAEKFVETA